MLVTLELMVHILFDMIMAFTNTYTGFTMIALVGIVMGLTFVLRSGIFNTFGLPTPCPRQAED